MSYESPHDLERSVGYESSHGSGGTLSPSRLAEVRSQLESARRVKRWLTAPVVGILAVGSLLAVHERGQAKVQSYATVDVVSPPTKPSTTMTLPPTTVKPRAEATTTTPTTVKKAPPTTLPAPTTTLPKRVAAADLSFNPPSLAGIQYDIAWPQCKAANSSPDTLPPSPEVIVQSTGGQFDKNSPCLGQEAKHDGESTMFYFMAGANTPNAYQTMYDYMHQNIKFIETYTDGSFEVWLDVEWAMNDQGEELWTNDIRTNIQGLEGAQQAIADEQVATGGRVREGGIYSNMRFWRKIAGSWRPNVPMWYTTGEASQSEALKYCNRSDLAFANGPWALVQYQPTPAIDMDVACPTAPRQ